MWRAAVGDLHFFMSDNVRPWRTTPVNGYLESEGINRLDWPAVSTDLNHFDHAWGMLSQVCGSTKKSTIAC